MKITQENVYRVLESVSGQGATVKEMLIAARDYIEKGRLKFFSDANELPLIMVSNWLPDGTDKNEIRKQAKRNVVYVAFQTFARTDIEK